MSEHEGGFAPDADPAKWIKTNGEGGPVTVGSILAYAAADLLNLPHRSYLVKGLLAPNEISVIVGPPKCGKSFFALHLGYAAAQEHPVFGRKVRGCSVLYVAAEGERGIAKRVTALARKYGVAARFHVIAQPLDLLHTDAGQSPHLRDLIKVAQMVGAELIIIDTLNRVLAGADENSSQDMGHFIANMSELRAATGAHIAIVHHGNEASGGTKPRGHSSLRGAADLIVEITKEENGTRRAYIAAAKDDTDGAALAFKLNVVELGEDEDGDPITTLLVEELAEAPPPTAGLSKTAKAALSMLENLIAGHGSPLPPGADFPSHIHGCQEADWAAECETRRLSTSERERDRKRAFQQAVASLLQARRVAARDGWVWLCMTSMA